MPKTGLKVSTKLGRDMRLRNTLQLTIDLTTPSASHSHTHILCYTQKFIYFQTWPWVQFSKPNLTQPTTLLTQPNPTHCQSDNHCHTVNEQSVNTRTAEKKKSRTAEEGKFTLYLYIRFYTR